MSDGVSMKGQSRLASVVEAIANMATGYALAILIGIAVYPLFGAKFTLQDNFALAAIFYAASFLRSYIWRRVFNHLQIRRKL